MRNMRSNASYSQIYNMRDLKNVNNDGRRIEKIATAIKGWLKIPILEKSNIRCTLANRSKIASLGKAIVELELIDEIYVPLKVEVIDGVKGKFTKEGIIRNVERMIKDEYTEKEDSNESSNEEFNYEEEMEDEIETESRELLVKNELNQWVLAQ
ncbi:ribonuclease H-like domain-containing protein [Rhizophagus clarus]|uniref:Ribonuclease H-like domain-containing protein n=1 Tax=Rhizophagus clarus TaxID=94130 RepID=A0A8H3LSA3_9GLOM|nr:ribonuclease H-like domain-containing protein [Rhizophagus clarus]